MTKTYSQEFKEQIVQEYFAGSTITELGKEHSLSRNTVYSWIQQHGATVKRTKPIKMPVTVLLAVSLCEDAKENKIIIGKEISFKNG